jgi:AcrR family transcriptional regulator
MSDAIPEAAKAAKTNRARQGPKEKRQSPKDKLLAAVVEVALAGGIADKSLRAIAEAAGTSHRMLIHHFGSREGLLVEVIRAVEARQRVALDELGSRSGDMSGDLAARFWAHLRSPELAPQERLFFEVYGQALQGREWAKPLLEGIVEDWVGPVAAMLEAVGISRQTARTVARLYVAVGRGLLLDVLATGDDGEVDAAMRFFSDMLFSQLAGLIQTPGELCGWGPGRIRARPSLWASRPLPGGLYAHDHRLSGCSAPGRVLLGRNLPIETLSKRPFRG